MRWSWLLLKKEHLMIVIHIVDNGKALCGFMKDGGYHSWPKDHMATTLEESEVSNCARCRNKVNLTVTMHHWLETIEGIYAILSDDDGGEGVVGAPIGPHGEWVPLFAADETRLENILKVAKQFVKHYQVPVRLVRFTNREVMEEIKP
jgi:hypothetical protein